MDVELGKSTLVDQQLVRSRVSDRSIKLHKLSRFSIYDLMDILDVTKAGDITEVPIKECQEFAVSSDRVVNRLGRSVYILGKGALKMIDKSALFSGHVIMPKSEEGRRSVNYSYDPDIVNILIAGEPEELTLLAIHASATMLGSLAFGIEVAPGITEVSQTVDEACRETGQRTSRRFLDVFNNRRI